VVALQITCGDLGHHPPGDLTHGAQHRQLTLVILDGHVIDDCTATLTEQGQQLGIRHRQIHEGHHDLSRAGQGALAQIRGMDLDDDIGAAIYLGDGVHNASAGRLILFVGEAAAQASALLHHDLVSAADQIADGTWTQSDPLLVDESLPRNADDHE